MIYNNLDDRPVHKYEDLAHKIPLDIFAVLKEQRFHIFNRKMKIYYDLHCICMDCNEQVKIYGQYIKALEHIVK